MSYQSVSPPDSRAYDWPGETLIAWLLVDADAWATTTGFYSHTQNEMA